MLKSLFQLLFFILFVLSPQFPRADNLADQLIINQHSRQSLQRYLQGMETIRIYVVYAPGRGHQIANLRIIQRLRELGFRGTTQVVFEPVSDISLSQLVPEFDLQNKNVQHVNSALFGPLEFIPKNHAVLHFQNKKVTLGLSGAFDVHHSKPKGTGQAEIRDLLNVETFVQLQPRLWESRGTREIYRESGETISLQGLKNLGTAHEIAVSENWPAFLQNQLQADSPYANKVPFLSHIMTKQNYYDLMPAYSLDTPHFPDQSIAPIMEGLQKAITEQPSLFNKPIVVPVFSEFRWKPHLEAVRAQLGSMGIPYLDAESSSTLERLASAKPGEIIFAHVGPVPPAVFDPLVISATLPVILEGKNLTNTLVDAGKIFVNIFGSLIDLTPELEAAHISEKTKTLIKEAISSLDEGITRTPMQKDHAKQALVQFFTESKIPTSEVSMFFSGLKNNPAQLDRDLLGRALMEVIKPSTSPEQAITCFGVL